MELDIRDKLTLNFGCRGSGLMSYMKRVKLAGINAEAGKECPRTLLNTSRG